MYDNEWVLDDDLFWREDDVEVLEPEPCGEERGGLRDPRRGESIGHGLGDGLLDGGVGGIPNGGYAVIG